MKSLDFATRRKVILQSLCLPRELRNIIDKYIYDEWTPTFIYALPPGKVVGYAYREMLYIQNNILYPHNIKLKWNVVRIHTLNRIWMVMECTDGIVIYNTQTNQFKHIANAQYPCMGDNIIYWLQNPTIHWYNTLKRVGGKIHRVTAIHLQIYEKLLVFETPNHMKMILDEDFMTYTHCVSIHHVPDGDFYEPCIVGHDGVRNSGSFYYPIDGIHRSYQYKYFIICETGSTHYLWNVQSRQVIKCEITDHDLFETDNGFYAITENSLNVYC